MDPQLVLFAIESAVRLGRKVHEVLVDETANRALLLPVGDLFQAVDETVALDFFLDDRNAALTRPGGPYAGLSRQEKLVAYKTLLEVDRRLDARQVGPTPSDLAEASRLIAGLGRFQQVRKGFGPNSPAQRILGTIVEIGVDYFATHPEALGSVGGRDSRAVQVVKAFVGGLTETDFAEGSFARIAGDVLGAALQTLGTHAELVADDARLQLLLSGVACSLAGEMEKAPTPGAKEGRAQFFRRIGSGILRGAASAFEQNVDLFWPRPDAAEGDPDHPQALRAVVSGTLTQFLTAIADHEDLFTSESVELLFRSALGAVGENAELLTRNGLLQQFISATAKALTDTQGAKLFSSQTVALILREGLEVLGENVETLVDPENPRQQFLASALSAMAASLAGSLAGPGGVKALLSARQLTQLASVVFAEVAAHPEQLLGDSPTDPRKTALAQIIASVARSLGEDPTRLVNGAGFLRLVRSTLQVAVKNADQLLDLKSANPTTNVLFQALQQAATSVLAGDERKMVTREVFVDLVEQMLPVVSANLGPLMEGEQLVAETVQKVLGLAQDVLKPRINGANLPAVVRELLRLVLRGDLNLEEPTALVKATVGILSRV